MLDSVMPYMYNDLNIRSGLIWGKVVIDTIKEEVIVSNLDKAALNEIETNISESMIALKRKYPKEESERYIWRGKTKGWTSKNFSE